VGGSQPTNPLRRRPVPIQGTNIKLDTPEAIEAWIEERKRRWPTTARVAEKKRKVEEAIASGGLLPEHLMSGGMKRPRLPFNAEATTGRGRGGGRGDRGRGRGRGRGGRGGRAWRGAPARAQLPARPPPTEPRRDVQATANNADSGSDSDAPEVLSAKRPTGIEAYGSSSSDVEHEHERPQSAAADPPLARVPSQTDPCPSGASAGASPVHPPTVPSASARPTDVPRKAPPQPKKPPRNPFAARTSLLRSVSERISCPL
jgi:hypothetical protein